MASANKTIKSLLYSSANIYTEFLLGLVVSIIIARSLGPETYGSYTYIVWLASLGIIVVNSGVGVGAIKFFAELLGNRDTSRIVPLHAYFSRVQIVKALVFCLLFALLIIAFPAAVAVGDYSHLVWLVIPVVAFKSYHMYQVSLFKGLQEFRYLATTALIVAPLNLVLVISAYYWFASVLGYLTVFLVTSIAFWLASTVGRRTLISADLRKQGEGVQLDDQFRGRLKMHLRTVSVTVILGFIVYGQSELFFLKQFATIQDIAFFSIGFTLTRAAMELVPGVYNNLLLSKISYDVADEETSEARSVVNSSIHMLMLGSLVGVPLIIYAKDVTEFLYGQDYASASLVIQVLCISAIAGGVRKSTNAYLMSVDKQPVILKIMIVAVTATLLLDYFLIQGFGLWGAIIAYVTVDFLLAIVVSAYAFSLLRRWPDVRKIGKLGLASGVAAGLTLTFANITSFPYSFIPGGLLCASSFLALLFLLDCFEVEEYMFMRQLLPKKGSRLVAIGRRVLDRRIRANEMGVCK